MIPRTTLHQLAQTHRQQALARFQSSSVGRRQVHPTMATIDPRASLKPAARVAGRKLDVWYVWVFYCNCLLVLWPFIKELEHNQLKVEERQEAQLECNHQTAFHEDIFL